MVHFAVGGQRVRPVAQLHLECGRVALFVGPRARQPSGKCRERQLHARVRYVRAQVSHVEGARRQARPARRHLVRGRVDPVAQEQGPHRGRLSVDDDVERFGAAQHPHRRQCPGGPLSEEPAPPLTQSHDPRVAAQTRGVQKRRTVRSVDAHLGDVDGGGGAAFDGPGGGRHRRYARRPGEIVQRPGREHGQRKLLAHRHLGGRADGAVTAGHSQRARPVARDHAVELSGEMQRMVEFDVGCLRQQPAQLEVVVRAAGRGIAHDHKPFPAGQGRRRAGRTQPRRFVGGLGPPVPRGQRHRRAERPAGNHVTGPVHADVHPRIGNRGRHGRDERGRRRRLDRHAGGERRSRGGMSGRKRRGHRPFHQAAHEGHRIVGRATARKQWFGDTVGQGTGPGDRDQPAQRRPPVPLAADTEHGGHGDPEQAVIGRPGQPDQRPIERGGPQPCGVVHQALVGVGQPADDGVAHPISVGGARVPTGPDTDSAPHVRHRT